MTTKPHLIIHPHRLRILEALAERPRSTYELAELLPDIARPSLYRHLKALLDGELILVHDTRRVRGVLEKTYALAQAPHLNSADLSGMSSAEHYQLFSAFVAGLLNGFRSYLDAAGEQPDFLADQVGFSEVTFYASHAEMETFREKLLAALQDLVTQPATPTRPRRKLTIISHPLLTPDLEEKK